MQAELKVTTKMIPRIAKLEREDSEDLEAVFTKNTKQMIMIYDSQNNELIYFQIKQLENNMNIIRR